MTERQLQDAVLKLARLRGFLCYHTHDSRRSQPGFPDLVMVRGGLALAVELKVRGRKPTDAQLEWLHALNEVRGITSYLWTDRDWLDGTIEEVLQ